MISICIPVFNFDISKLIEELQCQIKSCKHSVEIIIIDDHSELKYKKNNRVVANNEHYIELKKNVGRAKIRNLFLSYAKCQHLLFLDCDSLIVSNNFLNNYIETILNLNSKIVCGGRVYKKNKPERKKYLRWKYGVASESKTAEDRRKEPNKSFMTNNFLIEKSLFEKIKFDEKLTKYGHEDTLFGYCLKKNNVEIKHIDNPVLNNDLESNKEYIQKTNEAIQNLVTILKSVNYDPNFSNDVALLKFYFKIKKRRIIYFIIKITSPVFNPLLAFLLKNGIVCNISTFNFYKLCVLIKNMD